MFNEEQFASIFEKVEKKLSAKLLEINTEDLKGTPIFISSTVLCSALTSALAKSYVSMIYTTKADLNTIVEVAKKTIEGTIREYHTKMGEIPNDQKVDLQQSDAVHPEGAQDLGPGPLEGNQTTNEQSDASGSGL
jgi:hypothetical protein